MKVKTLLGILTSLAVFSSGTAIGWSEQTERSWIVRSSVQPNMSMWGPGPVESIHLSDTYEYDDGTFSAGFGWNVQLDHGTVFGNVEGAVSAQYENRLCKPGETNIKLAYSGLKDESQIGANALAKVSVEPTVGVRLPWYLGGDIQGTLPMTAVNADFSTKQDYTAGLGEKTTDAQSHDMLSLGGDLLLLEYGIDVYMESTIFFTPKSYTGTLEYRHVESQSASRTVPVEFWNDAAFDTGSFLDLNVELDKPGHWEFSLEDFTVDNNSFRTDLDLGLKAALGIPLLGSEIGIGADISLDDSGDFGLRFGPHNLNGDTTLGNFSIYVDPVPIPGAIWLLGSGFIGLVGLRRKFRS